MSGEPSHLRGFTCFLFFFNWRETVIITSYKKGRFSARRRKQIACPSLCYRIVTLLWDKARCLVGGTACLRHLYDLAYGESVRHLAEQQSGCISIAGPEPCLMLEILLWYHFVAPRCQGTLFKWGEELNSVRTLSHLGEKKGVLLQSCVIYRQLWIVD